MMSLIPPVSELPRADRRQPFSPWRTPRTERRSGPGHAKPVMAAIFARLFTASVCVRAICARRHLASLSAIVRSAALLGRAPRRFQARPIILRPRQRLYLGKTPSSHNLPTLTASTVNASGQTQTHTCSSLAARSNLHTWPTTRKTMRQDLSRTRYRVKPSSQRQTPPRRQTWRRRSDHSARRVWLPAQAWTTATGQSSVLLHSAEERN